MNGSLVYWDGGSGKTGRGRGASELEGTLAEYVSASPAPSNQQDLCSSKDVFFLQFSIFKVDKPAPSRLRRQLGAFAWPLDRLLLHWPWQGVREGAQAPPTGSITGDPGVERRIQRLIDQNLETFRKIHCCVSEDASSCSESKPH